MDVHAVAVVLLALITINGRMMMPFGYVSNVPEKRKCDYVRSSGMLKARCIDMNLKEVPQNLKSSAEILDLSWNRIKKLNRNSFERYSGIEFLVLYENKIQSVEPGTFAMLNSVEEIDLSYNALITIPLEIFQLPSLRNLYVDSNDLINFEQDLLTLETPINAPLEYLNIADCGLTNLPDLGVLPNLWHINASLNPLTDLSVDSMANMCNLRTIDLTKTKLTKCACQQVNRYLRFVDADVKYVPPCLENLDASVCPDLYNNTVKSASFQSCKSQAELAKMFSWLWPLIGGVAALTVLLLAWFCYRRRSKSKKNKKPKSKSKSKSIDVPSKHQPLVSPTLALKSHNDRTMLQDSDCV